MYPLIAEIAEIDMLAPPFEVVIVTQEAAEAEKVFGCDDPLRIDRGLSLNRYTGETVYVVPATGWGVGSFGIPPFGWS